MSGNDRVWYRHEAIHAAGAVLTENLFKLLQGNEKSLNLKPYRKRLKKLTAKHWRKGLW